MGISIGSGGQGAMHGLQISNISIGIGFSHTAVYINPVKHQWPPQT